MAGWADYETTYGVTFSTGAGFLGKPTGVLRAIAKASNERAVEVDIPTLSPTQGILTYSLHQKITDLIPLFVDHTQAIAGKFSGMTGRGAGNDTFPMWTVASLESEIGSSRPTMPLGAVVTVAWIIWHYEALNLLIWTKEYRDDEPPLIGSGHSYEEVYRSSGRQGSYAALVSAWGSKTDTSTTTSLRSKFSIFLQATDSWLMSMVNWQGTLSIASSVTRDVDQYAYFRGADPGDEGANFYNFGYSSLLVSEYSYLSTTSIDQLSDRISQGLIYGDSVVLANPGPTGELTLRATDFVLLHKFNVLGGFDFVS